MECGKNVGRCIAYPESKPEILVFGSDGLNCSVWKHELVRLDIINRKSIQVRLPGMAFFVRLFLSQNMIELGHSPPPSAKPATPTPDTQPPTTFKPIPSNSWYTVSRVSPALTSTVLSISSTVTWLNRVMEICTPVVDEKPDFVAWPPPFTAKKVRVSLIMRNCGRRAEDSQRRALGEEKA